MHGVNVGLIDFNQKKPNKLVFYFLLPKLTDSASLPHLIRSVGYELGNPVNHTRETSQL